MSWAWLSSEELDLSRGGRGRAGDECTVWVEADPYGVFGLPRSADRNAVRAAYRRLARRYHPDTAGADPEAADTFRTIQAALAAIDGETAVSVEPVSGAWWRFAGFSGPDLLRPSLPTVAGLRFELRDLHRIPLGGPRDEVRVSYDGETLPLTLTYSPGRLALPLWLARAGAAAESALLVLLCLTIIPVVAVLLALDVYLLSNESVVLTWLFGAVILAAGYGALAGILLATGHELPSPRRAVYRARAAVVELRALARRSASATSPGNTSTEDRNGSAGEVAGS